MSARRHHAPPRPGFTRREFLQRSGAGFGALAFAALQASSAVAAGPRPGLPHRPPRARSVIFLYMDGGPSQVDTFDPKPRLDREHGRPIWMKTPPTQFNNNGNVLRSPWKFDHHGESGLPVSALFPHVATCADDLAVDVEGDGEVRDGQDVGGAAHGVSGGSVSSRAALKASHSSSILRW